MAKLYFLLFIIFVSSQSTFGNTPMTSNTIEICDNGIDDDNDGLIDCYDPDCENHVSCFDCTSDYYQIISNFIMVSMNPVNGSFQYIASIFGASQVNGQGHNILDGHVYSAAIINGKHTLAMVNKNGMCVDLLLDLPTSEIYQVGACDDQGNILLGRFGEPFISIDLNTQPLSYTLHNFISPEIKDIAYDVTQGKYYGINNFNELIEIDLENETTSIYQLEGAINMEEGNYGTVWSNNDGYLFTQNGTSGKIFKIETSSLLSSFVKSGTGNVCNNDGFNCLNSTPNFETDCSNGIDDDGDGLIDCEDPDCGNDNVCVTEICFNGTDDDNDGLIDCDDPECYSVNGCYEICNNGIDDNNDGLIDGDDPSCNTGSGGEGGLESNNRLAGLISSYKYQCIKKENQNKYKKENLNQVITVPESITLRNGDLLSQVINSNLIPDTEAFESSPNYLADITNATESYSLDLYKEDRRIASILGLKTEESVYEHTKFICDRLGGGEILDLKTIMIDQEYFTVVEFKQANGNKEFALSFSAYINDNSQLTIESHWSLDQYPLGDEIYNFQIWANSQNDLHNIGEAILTQLESAIEINKYNTTPCPEVFVSKGYYSNGQLKLEVINKSNIEEIILSGAYSRSETKSLQTFETALPIGNKYRQWIDVEIGELYDVGLRLSPLDSDQGDDLFFADGAWGLEKSESTLINHYEVSPESSIEINNNQLRIERSVHCEGLTTEPITIFRSLKPKFQAVDLSAFNQLEFNSKGEGKIEIVLVKSSIQEWDNQPRLSITTNNINSKKSIDFNAFKSTSLESKDFSDVTMIAFTYYSMNKEFDISLNQITFNRNTKISKVLDTYESVVSPNPSNGNVQLKFNSSYAENAEIIITDIAGRTIYRSSYFITQGNNIHNLNLVHLNQGSYFYIVRNDSHMLCNGKFNVFE